MNLQGELTFAIELARKAGKIMRDNVASNTAEWKPDHTPVTEADTTINQLVIDSVMQSYPGDGIIGEEASHAVDSPRQWIVDPIDGTQPFNVGAPVSTFCLGLVIEGKAELGVVYDPYLDRMYHAIRGNGAYMNDTRIHGSTAEVVDKQYAFISSRMTDTGAKSSGQIFDDLVDVGAKAFNFKSVVYGFMRVAEGSAAIALAGPSHAWDFAAAEVILGETNLKVTNLNGQAFSHADPRSGGIVTAPAIYDEVYGLIHP